MRKMLAIGLLGVALCLLAVNEASAGRRKRCNSCCDFCYPGCYTGCPTRSCGVGCCPAGVCVLPAGHGHAMHATHAMVIVDLPDDARLTIDGAATTSTSGQRIFQTPDLEDGRTFHYTLRAEVTRDGRLQTVTERIAVRSGETTRVQLTLPVQGVASR